MARNVVLISCGEKFGRWGPGIESEVNYGISSGQKFGQREPVIKFKLVSIIGFEILVARNGTNGHLRSKLGPIIGFLVARNLVNGNLRSKLG